MDNQPDSKPPLNADASMEADAKAAPVEEKPKKKLGRILGYLVAFIVGALIAFFVDYRAVYDWILGFSYQPSTEMSQTISNIELTGRGERIVKASFAELQNSEEFNQNCPNSATETSVLGCYYDWHIYVFNVDNAELDGIKEAVLAHELLHADWQRERSWIKNELEPVLRETYEQNKDTLADHMKTYTAENFVDELHSIIGTQIDVDKLPQRLKEHYRSIFKNHAKVVAYYDQYNGKFTELKREMEDLAAKIDQMKQQIEKKTADYRKKSEVLAEDISEFNRRASGSYYTSQWDFDRDRAALVARQKDLDKDYKDLSDLVDKANEYVDKYNQKIAHSSELYRSINSNSIQKVEDPTK
ncbi:hypothetical protein J5500_01325 [Candidatus Saccharibacteria bacterium]|nr:hypothetical protein [Candidatus Saccharibacteria bacterium]